MTKRTPQLLALCLPFSILVLTGPGCNDNSETGRLDPVQDGAVTVEAGGEIDPIASPAATRGGEYRTWGGQFPKSLNVWLDSWHLSGEIMGLMFEGLVELHSTDNKPVGGLAERWESAPDGRTFTFYIHPAAKWNDGQPVTASDIQFYYDTIMNPDHRTTPVRVILERFERPQVIDAKTVRIVSREKHWKAFWDAAGFMAFPKHTWEGQDFNRINFEFPVVSGPYELREVKRNRYVLMKRRADWWGRVRKYNQNKFNFDYIRYRFIEDQNVALEAFKKGDFDAYAVYTSSIWVTQTQFEQAKKNWVVRQEVFNKEPKSFQGMAINMRLPRFQDVRVREALCHLFNGRLMNEKLMFNEYFLLDTYFPDLYPNNDNPATEHCEYDPARARALLDAAGWKVGSDGVRARGGERFTVVLPTYSPDLRHLNVFVDDLKQAGIDARIDQMSQATLTERVDNFQFDIFWINTGAGRLRDEDARFHSSTADQVASMNLPGVKDAVVDGLLNKLRSETNLDRRNQLFRDLDRRLLELRPYVLMWQSDKTRLLYWNKFGRPQYVLDKYNRENSIIAYWWFDSRKAADLEAARKANQALPVEPAKVKYAGR